MKNITRIFTWMVVAFFATTIMACSDDDDQVTHDWSNAEFLVSNEQMTFSATGGTAELYIQSVAAPSVTSDGAWLTLEQRTSDSQKMFVYKVTAPQYTENNDRTATITVAAGGTTKTVAVKQVAQDGLIIENTSFNVGVSESTITVNLKANGTFTVTPDVEWIVENDTRANMADYSRTFVVAANVGTARTGKISFTLNDITESVTVNQEGAEMGGIKANAMELAKMMYPGWNLGNTMEAVGSGVGAEMAWQATKTSQALIDFVKAQGFRSVRIPCSWYIHSTDGEIDAAWMARVKEVVNYCIADGLYVVLNDHWDGGWIEVLGFSKSDDKYEAVDEAIITEKTEMLKKLWIQIAEEFKNYDEHLLFAGLNEPFQENVKFNNRHKELTPILNRYNQAFVDAVRSTGGNNAKRTLVVQGPATSTASAVDPNIGFVMPTDTETGYLMAEVHYYEPWDFCGQEDNATWFWGSANHVDGSSHNPTWGEESWLNDQFGKLKSTFVDNGYPVIIGEYGAQWRSLSANQQEHDASVKSFFYEVNRQAVNNGLVTFAWDINITNQNGEKGTMTILNRANLSVFCTPAMEGITEGVAAGSWPN